MKKSLVTLAILGSFAGVASAATNVTLFGNIDVGYEKVNEGTSNYQGSSTTSSLQQGGDSEKMSIYGLRGEEDLGNGLTAIFNLQGRMDASNGVTESRLFHRESTVGLKGSFGEVKLGRAKSQIELGIGGTSGDRVAYSDAYRVASTRHSNGLFYSYSDNGIAAGFNVTTKGGAADNTNEGQKTQNVAWGARLGWSGEVGGMGLGLAAAYQNDGGVKSSDKVREWGVTASLSVNPVTVTLTHAHGQDTANSLRGTNRFTASVAGALTSNDNLYVTFVKDSTNYVGGAQDSGHKIGLGWSHSLSKRTRVYAEMERNKASGVSGHQMEYAAAVAHSF